jgi:outer membrane protein OmpA-like peptidoglycan-associated protein
MPSANQIITLAKGQTQPRRPNFTESGADDPAGRRANRRAEIYLDFD